MHNAPIALFVYNRPQHTKITLESLCRCWKADESDLYIYCDGPKNQRDEKAVKEVREIVKSHEWCGSVHIKESAKNLGLAHSLISGITELVNKYGRIIVLEDDLVLSPYFLNFMNDALDFYQDESKVMHISGYMFPVQGQLPETFFYRATSCWGWATWDRAWQCFVPDIHTLLAGFQDKHQLWEFDIKGSMNYCKMLQDQANGTIDSWAIRWYASVFLNNGLCLHPGKSLVNNIGHDGTGVHCGSTDMYSVSVSKEQVSFFTQNIEESKKAVKLMANFYRGQKKSFSVRIVNKLKMMKNLMIRQRAV